MALPTPPNNTPIVGNMPVTSAFANWFTQIKKNIDAFAASTGILSFNGRTASNVVPQLGDYSASLISNNSSVAGSTVKDALNTLLAGGGSSYVLPKASSTVLGGVKIGSGISEAADGTISVSSPTGTLVLGGATPAMVAANQLSIVGGLNPSMF